MPGQPLSYLERLELQNALFNADNICFVGVGGTRDAPRLITRQKHIEGDPTSPETIRALMLRQGYLELPAAACAGLGNVNGLGFVHEQMQVAVFDLHPANVLTTYDAIRIPIIIDCIPTRLTAQGLAKLLRAIKII